MTAMLPKGMLCPKGCGDLIAVDPLDTMAERTQRHYSDVHDEEALLQLSQACSNCGKPLATHEDCGEFG